MNVHIALVMMVKNEEKRILVSLESVKNIVESLIIYDTGSTDNTIDIIEQFSNTSNIPLFLLKGDFEDFSTSRNKLLDFSDKLANEYNIDLLLLLDCNDELQNGNELLEIAPKLIHSREICWMLCQKWYSPSIHEYFNIRLLKPNQNLRYTGVVHEYLKKKDSTDILVSNKLSNIILFQDRVADMGKTTLRVPKDYELLLNEHNRNPEEPRTLFYLAQTCRLLSKNEEAYKYYSLRSKIKIGFYEEVYQCASRAEPYVKIANYYRDKHWCLAYYFAKMACECQYPVNHLLWVNKVVYDYERYHVLGICAYYYKKYEEGKQACIQAIKVANKDIDKQNLEYYKLLEEQNINTEEKHRQIFRR